MLIYLLFAIGCRSEETECVIGMSVGIDKFGAEDPLNGEVCYPTRDSAYIVSCNNRQTNSVEMKIAVAKVRVTSGWSLPVYMRYIQTLLENSIGHWWNGFELDLESDVYVRTLTMTEETRRISKNQEGITPSV